MQDDLHELVLQKICEGQLLKDILKKDFRTQLINGINKKIRENVLLKFGHYLQQKCGTILSLLITRGDRIISIVKKIIKMDYPYCIQKKITLVFQ